MNVKVIKSKFLSELQLSEQIKKNLNSYQSGRFKQLPAEWVSDSRVVMDEIPELKHSDSVGDTFENAKKLYQALKNMDRITASDQRLWAWLACGPFSKYMAARWATGSPWNKPDVTPKIKNVLMHWFLQRQSSAHYYRHGLAYLWWGVEMTKGPDSEKDQYKLTKEFFSTQEYTRQLAGKLGQSRTILRAVLLFVSQNPKIFSGAKDGKIRKFVPRLNMVAAYRLLPSMTEESLQSIMAEIANNL